MQTDKNNFIMKTTKILTMAAMALLQAGMASCTPEEVSPQPQPNPEPEVGVFDSDGATVALFSVSATKQVRFSRGNLQYQASTDTWRFAEQQYAIIGGANENISETNSGWIDLFGWGTSGWASGASEHQPWSSSFEDTDYWPGGNATNSLVGACANADWGVYNAISNGGNRPGMWRTLTNVEWRYLLAQREGCADKWAKATVDGVKGLVFLPDEWTLPQGLTFSSARNGFSTNTYTVAQWEQMENAGAVFLPAAGVRYAIFPDYMGVYGAYWSSSRYTDKLALVFVFSDNLEHPASGEHRAYGLSVRLVKDAD